MTGAGGPITWRELWVETTGRLGGDANEARWICEELSGARGLEWLDQLDRPAGERAVAQLDAMVARRLGGEPLQYVLGSWAFRRVELLVDRRVLIPRPETELVAGAAIERALQRTRPLVVADLGTGSGAIGLSMAVELPLVGVTVWMTDASPDALDVARANLAGIGRAAVNVHLAHGSWFDALPHTLRGGLDVVVSNPPYIATGDPELDTSVHDWEPALALFADDGGLAAFAELAGGAAGWLAPGGSLVLEIGATQGADVAALLARSGLVDIEILPDLSGRDRIAVARRPAGVS